MNNIRNFCIIAHIDHGKSTLADRLLERTGTISKREMKEQILDSLELERERGITIKLVPVRMDYTALNGENYILNLIDTPGHVDFGYEVSRSLAACEGALLVVDATQGVEAQTVANAYQAIEQGLEIIPVINKIDLPSARIDEVKKEIEEVIGIDASNAILASAKDGRGIDEILERIITEIPAPENDVNAPLSALIFDSVYDNYRGVICYVRIKSGQVNSGQNILFMNSELQYPVNELGVFKPAFTPVKSLMAGEVGYVAASIKELSSVSEVGKAIQWVGDTITDASKPVNKPLEGYKKVKSVVFCGFYPIERDNYEQLREGLEKLSLNDSAITYEPESSEALGFGFRCGFLGLLHMEVVRERLREEYNIELVATVPNVIYEIEKTNNEIIEAHRPTDFPEISEIKEIREPYIKLSIFLPSEFTGRVMQLEQEKRGIYKSMDYLTPERVRLIYEMPLSEFIIDFHDKLKSQTRGYASLDYEFIGMRASELVRVDILVNGEAADAFSFICHKDQAYQRGHAAVTKLKELIPSQLFEIAIQASVGKRVIVRVNVKALRKDVLAKCYGGDITRKRKLLEKQKEGKKRMKQIGKVSIPQEAFLAFMGIEDETK